MTQTTNPEAVYGDELR